MSSDARLILLAGALAFAACADFSRGEPSPAKDAGGTVTIEDAPLGGARLRVRLPAA